MRICIGIDAGGTFTDIAVVDLDNGKVLEKAKESTTRPDPSQGISLALAKISLSHKKHAKLAVLSTTLATNAIVEGMGQPVGLFIMPPYGKLDPDNFIHSPKVVIEGQMDIDGTELVPVNETQVRQAAYDMVRRYNVTAFAVAGFAGHVNPTHELLVKKILQEETGLPVTCGNDISEGLNYRIRAETAALNAKIIPYMISMIGKIQQIFTEHSITAPIMIVKSDGSLMALKSAIDKPVFTILSGPAASVAGACFLGKQKDAVVVDIGGTTTDIALVKNGEVPLCNDGSIVGRWHTHIAGVDMRTTGLGGDSVIRFIGGKIHVGPKRVVPVGWLAKKCSSFDETINYLEEYVKKMGICEGAEILFSNCNEIAECSAISEREKKILTALKSRPMCLAELAEQIGYGAWQFLETANLENRYLVQRYGLTPTDILQATGRLNLIGVEISKKMAILYAKSMKMSVDDLCNQVMQNITEKLITEIMQTCFDREKIGEIEDSPVAMKMIKNVCINSSDNYSVKIHINHPIVGVGAPAAFFIPHAADLLSTKVIIPEHAEVANAVGAAVSCVKVIKRLFIEADEKGIYRVNGLAGTHKYENLEMAHKFAESKVRELVLEAARENGIDESSVEIVSVDRSALAGTGQNIFVERIVEGRLSAQIGGTIK